MAIRKVSLYKYAPLPHGWRYVRAVFHSNGNIKPHIVLINKQEQRITDGYYVLGYAGKWERVGNDPKEATRLMKCRSHELGAVAAGSTALQLEQGGGMAEGETLLTAIANYIKQEFIDRGRSLKTVHAHRNCLEEFAKSCQVEMLSAVTRRHCLQYVNAYLINRGNADHTRANKFGRLKAFLIHEKFELLTSKDKPDFAEEAPLILEDDELAQFWKACPPHKQVMYTVFLTCGLRLGELQTLRWADIDFQKGLIRIQPRPEYNWVPKKHHCRAVGVSDTLLEKLRVRKLTSHFPLIFHTRSGKKLTHLWEDTQAIFKKTKVSMAKAHPHAFRGTFCTSLFRSNMDFPSIQKLMGHDPKYPEVTMRYAAPLTEDSLREKKNRVRFAVAAE
ncbi:MAG TPA: site-specific integrase [Acidobacteriaceae bacterium]|nr:site-specific integrase [Acidobacteriaceae bacterium]